jgi:hypothetical protein
MSLQSSLASVAQAERRVGMSLFALNHAYQRSIDRIWEDFAAHSRAQTEPAPEEVESKNHQSGLNLGNQGEVSMQNRTQKAIRPQVVGGSELMQYDAKAWGCFLDSKHKE